MLAITGVVQPWHVYVLAFALGLATVVDNPTRQSFAIEMVGKSDLQNTIALNSAVFGLAGITGPAVAGLVIALVGTPTAFFVNAASYVAVLIGLKIMRPAELRPAERVERAKGQLREGLAYVRSRPDLLMTMVLVFFIATFGMNFTVTTALMSRSVFHTGASRFGVASAVFALGALIGALVAARRAKTGLRMMVVVGLAFNLLTILAAFMPTYWLLFLAILVPTGLTVIGFSTAANTSIQLNTPADMRGRVMGIYMLMFLGGAPIGSTLTGWVAEQFGTEVGDGGRPGSSPWYRLSSSGCWSPGQGESRCTGTSGRRTWCGHSPDNTG